MPNISHLIYVPILHTQREAGNIADSLKDDDLKKESRGGMTTVEQEKAINQMWDGICEKINELDISVASLRIYQDLLPVCGREKEIVEKLAEKNSRNHEVILELIKKGAKLEGTEDPNLLIKENDYLTELFNELSRTSKDNKEALKKYTDRSIELIKQRDPFIADRIKNTLKEGETPLLFMGPRHQLENLLTPQFVISYIIYRLPFKKVKDIYNV